MERSAIRGWRRAARLTRISLRFMRATSAGSSAFADDDDGMRGLNVAKKPARFLYALRARGAGARPDHGRGDDADLHHLHLRPAEPGCEQGLRLRPHQKPDAHGLR